MCGFGGKSGGGAPTPVQAAAVSAPIIAPMEADESSKRAGEQERRKRLAAAGRSSTILTGGLGDVRMAETGKKQLLGS